jgi:hypothetical protein
LKAGNWLTPKLFNVGLIHHLPTAVVTGNRGLEDSLAQDLARVQALEAQYHQEWQVKLLEESLYLCTTILESAGGVLDVVILVAYR